MKALIIGTDFLKDASGNLRIIETNTNVDVHNKIVPQLDWNVFKQFLIDNSITKLHFIYTDGNFIDVEKEHFFDTTTPNISLKDKMSEIMAELSGTFNHYEVPKNSITVPYIEDADDVLILRTSYDTTALVDENYAKDKVNFHRVIANETFAPNVYYHSETDTNLNIDQLTNLHTTTGDAPNYIVKTRYPNTNYLTYPKFYKIQSLESLQSLKDSLTELEYIEEYHFHIDNMINDKIGVIRSLDILYGNTLSTLHLGSYIMTSGVKMTAWPTEYSETNILTQSSRILWMTKSVFQKSGQGYILDDDTPILYNDNTLKYPNEILENDSLKTIKLTWVPENESDSDGMPLYIPGVNSGSFTNDLQTFTVSSSSVVDLGTQTKESLMIRVTLENGIVYDDLQLSSMLVEEYDTLRTTFVLTNRFRINDSIVFFDYINNTLTKSKITNLEIVYVNRKIYDINVETNDIFLPLADESLGLTFIQHNGQCFGWCAPWTCATWYCSACSFCGSPPSPKL
jgi:hypothetical protein